MIITPIEYNGIVFKDYRFDTETKQIYGSHNKPLKAVKHKTYSQITLQKDRVPHQVNYDKLIKFYTNNVIYNHQGQTQDSQPEHH